MSKTLERLEEKRQELYRKIMALGDFRPGMISVNFRKCGKKKCVCSKPEHPGHGPQYLWNTTQNGRSRGENLRMGVELEKVRQEIRNYKEFRRLCHEAVEINEEICRMRPVPEILDKSELEILKKKLQRKFWKRRKRR